MTDEAANFAQYERRLAFALARVAKGVETLVQSRDGARSDVQALREAEPVAAPADGSEEIEALESKNKALNDDLHAMREEVSGLQAQVELAAAEREAALSALEKRLGQRARALTQALSEIERLQAANTDLIAANRGMIDAGGRLAAVQINEALRAEVEALRAARAAERVALDEIIGGIEPLLSARDTALREEAEAETSEENQDG